MTAEVILSAPPSGRVTLRAPGAGDVLAIVELAQRLHAESTFSFLPFEPKKVASLVVVCSTVEDYFGQIAQRDGLIIGFLGGGLGTYPFCSERLAYDLGFYVAPEHRASTAAVRLIRRFRGWATERKARELSLSISSGIDSDRIGALYERMGMRRMGGIYRQRVGPP